jgi:ketosteroid isomerase-like protein
MSAVLPTAGQLAQRSFEVINISRPDLAAEICAEDYESVDPHGHDHAPDGVDRGPEVFANIVGYLHSIFDDLRFEVIESYDVGDRAATVVQLAGRYFGTSDRSGRGYRVSVEQVHLWHARDGKLVWHRFLQNDAEFARQLGA